MKVKELTVVDKHGKVRTMTIMLGQDGLDTPNVVFDPDHPAFNHLVIMVEDFMNSVKQGCQHNFDFLLFGLEEMRLEYGVSIDIPETLKFYMEEGISCDHEFIKKYYRRSMR